MIKTLLVQKRHSWKREEKDIHNFQAAVVKGAAVAPAGGAHLAFNIKINGSELLLLPLLYTCLFSSCSSFSFFLPFKPSWPCLKH